MNVFGKKSVAISVTERVLKQVARFRDASQSCPSIDQPKTADQKRGFRQPEIVPIRVTHDMPVPQEFLVDRVHGRHKARVPGVDQAQFRQQQNAVTQAAAKFAALPAATRHAWLVANLAALKAAAITVARLP